MRIIAGKWMADAHFLTLTFAADSLFPLMMATND
jgi:hypothetical protein